VIADRVLPMLAYAAPVALRMGPTPSLYNSVMSVGSETKEKSDG